jgi:hypothetical protein
MWVAIAIEVNFGEAGTGVRVVLLEKPLIIRFQIRQSDGLRARILGCDFALQILREITGVVWRRSNNELSEGEEAEREYRNRFQSWLRQ